MQDGIVYGMHGISDGYATLHVADEVRAACEFY